MPNIVISASENRICAAFTEWERRFREEPDRFMSETERVSESPESYGAEAGPFFVQVLGEVQTVSNRKQRKKG